MSQQYPPNKTMETSRRQSCLLGTERQFGRVARASWLPSAAVAHLRLGMNK